MILPTRNDFLRFVSRLCVIFGIIAVVLLMFNVFVFTFFAMLISGGLFMLAFFFRMLLAKPTQRPRARNDIHIIKRIK